MSKHQFAYGIPHFHWDIITRTIPGTVFLGLVWAVLLDKQHAIDLWGALTTHWYLWLGLFLMGYLVGMFADCVTWLFTDLGAEICYEIHKRKYPNNEWCKWNDLLRFYVKYYRTHEEAVYLEKCQVESKSLANLSLLILLFVVSTVGFWVFRGIHSRGFELLETMAFQISLLSCLGILGVLSAIFSCFRQNRRVWGTIAVTMEIYTETHMSMEPKEESLSKEKNN